MIPLALGVSEGYFWKEVVYMEWLLSAVGVAICWLAFWLTFMDGFETIAKVFADAKTKVAETNLRAEEVRLERAKLEKETAELERARSGQTVNLRKDE